MIIDPHLKSCGWEVRLSACMLRDPEVNLGSDEPL